jgi:hypothetical protein
VTPRKLSVGDHAELTLTLHSSSSRPQKLLVDYAVHHVKANGSTSPKVFKGWKLELDPGERRVLTKRHSFEPVTTRRYFAGRHAIDSVVNGTAVASASVDLQG